MQVDIDWRPLLKHAHDLCMKFQPRHRRFRILAMADDVLEYTSDPAARCAALLHGLDDEEKMPSNFLLEFPEEVQHALAALRRFPEEEKNDFIGRLMNNAIASSIMPHVLVHIGGIVEQCK